MQYPSPYRGSRKSKQAEGRGLSSSWISPDSRCLDLCWGSACTRNIPSDCFSARNSKTSFYHLSKFPFYRFCINSEDYYFLTLWNSYSENNDTSDIRRNVMSYCLCYVGSIIFDAIHIHIMSLVGHSLLLIVCLNAFTMSELNL